MRWIVACWLGLALTGCHGIHVDADIHPSLIPTPKPDQTQPAPQPQPKPKPWRRRPDRHASPDLHRVLVAAPHLRLVHG